MKGSDVRLAVVLIAVLGVLARIALWAVVPVTGDAVYHYSIAKGLLPLLPSHAFDFSTGGDPMWYPPLFHLFAHVFYLFGIEALTPLFFGVLSLGAYYLLFSRFYPRFLLAGMAFASFLPIHMYFSAVGYVESLLFLLSPLVFYCYLRYLEEKNRKFLALSLLLSVACFLTHYQGFIPLFAIAMHLFFRDRKTAVLFLTAGLLLASPWYIRNYITFGSPVWPLLFEGKYPVHQGYEAGSIVKILSFAKWRSLFFEYWVGAPNSGEDFMRNVDVAGRFLPFSGALFTLWLLAVMAFSALCLLGLSRLLGNDRFRGLFLVVLALSIVPLLLSNFVRMLFFAFPVLILGFVFGLERLSALKSLPKLAVVIIVLLAVAMPSFAYAVIYQNMVAQYAPFYSMVNAQLPADAVVLTVMDDQTFREVDRTVVSIGTVKEFRPTLACLMDSAGRPACLQKFGVTHVCCTSLRVPNIGGPVLDICNDLSRNPPVIEYSSGSVWGRCWGV
ncbi:MAG: hypothetical protein PHG85_03060 [Candidatus Altiarchaeota archaeon]|nr:hypothetical protein [Candidatus Altiarchaeota archaeon]